MSVISFTDGTPLTFVQLATKALLYQQVQPVAQGIETNSVDNLVDESKHQQQTGLMHRNAALPHIEQSCIIQLSDRRPVTTLHVIGINFQDAPEQVRQKRQ